MSKMERKSGKILGIRIDSTSRESLLTNIGKKIAENSKFSLFTPNPEIILQAQKDEQLASDIEKCTFSIPDGIGLKLFADPSLNIIHGRNLMLDLFELANQRGLRIFFVTSDEKDTNEKILKKLKKEYANIDAQSMIGPRLDNDAIPTTTFERQKETQLVEIINKFKPALLFVTFGAPKQEKWITKWLPKLNTIGALGLGGALDYYAGSAKSPPYWMQRLELEWLWRLVQEPKRARRIFNAVVVFTFKIFLEKLNTK